MYPYIMCTFLYTFSILTLPRIYFIYIYCTYVYLMLIVYYLVFLTLVRISYIFIFHLVHLLPLNSP